MAKNVFVALDKAGRPLPLTDTAIGIVGKFVGANGNKAMRPVMPVKAEVAIGEDGTPIGHNLSVRGLFSVANGRIILPKFTLKYRGNSAEYILPAYHADNASMGGHIAGNLWQGITRVRWIVRTTSDNLPANPLTLLRGKADTNLDGHGLSYALRTTADKPFAIGFAGRVSVEVTGTVSYGVPKVKAVRPKANVGLPKTDDEVAEWLQHAIREGADILDIVEELPTE